MEEKIGRNDPCPCGSGKKYKNCCLSKNQEAEKSLLGKRKITVKSLSEANPGQLAPKEKTEEQSSRKAVVDYAALMERSFGEALHSHEDKPPTPLNPDLYLKKPSE